MPKIDKNYYRNLWLKNLDVINKIKEIIDNHENSNRPTEDEIKEPVQKI